MSNSDLVRRYFCAYENKDRNSVESLLPNHFVFTSPDDYRIDRETYCKRCWPNSEKSPTYGIEKLFETGNEGLHPLRLQNQEWRQFPEHGVLHHRRKQTETIRNYRERVRQCEELAEYAMGEQIREILIDEQDYQIALATAFGQERANSA